MMSEKDELLQRKRDIEEELSSINRRLKELDVDIPRSYEEGV